jgi:hypothetical protein
VWPNLDSRRHRGLASLSEAASDVEITYSIDKILITTGKPNKQGLESSSLESRVSSGIMGNWIWSGLSYLETAYGINMQEVRDSFRILMTKARKK